MDNIAMKTLAEVSKLVESKEISPLELAEACLAQTEKYQPELNAYVCLLAEEARQAAKEAEHEILSGRYRGKLHGIPIALKDLYYTKDIPTTGGSEVLRQFRPARNGAVVQQLLDAGAILMGKTNTHEFAFGPTTEESCFGPTRNPWNPRKISGGSSGGSAVAVTTGMAYMAMGTDTGGSIRIPAAMCGCVGFKPSYGLVSLDGILALSFSLDHPGPLCRSVADAAITMDILVEEDKRKSLCIGAENSSFYGGLADCESLDGKIIGVPDNFFFQKTDHEVERVFREAADRLRELGAELRPVTIPALELVPDASTCIMFSEAAYLHRERYPAQKDLYQEGVAARLEEGRRYTAVEYIQAMRDRETIREAWERALNDLDAVIAPTCPIPAFDIGLGAPWTITTRGQQEPGKPLCTYHTRLANLTGAPALSLPAGLTSDGLPVGLMIMGKYGDDPGILRMGWSYEKHYSDTRKLYNLRSVEER